MKFKVKGDANIDIALRLKNHEFLFSIDLLQWSLFERKETEAGYKSIRILCFLFAVLDRKVFDAWVDLEYKNLFSADHMQDVDQRKPVLVQQREDVM